MLVEIFGNYPQIKVLDYLLMNPFGKYTKQQIAVGSEISRITLNTFINWGWGIGYGGLERL